MIFRRDAKSLPVYANRAAGGSGLAPPVDEMNQLLMGLVIAARRSLHVLANRIEEMESRNTGFPRKPTGCWDRG